MEKTISLAIPELIIVICTFYYYHFERFTAHGDKIKLIEYQSIATKCENKSAADDLDDPYHSVYGNIGIIGSNKANKYTWTFKILCLPGSSTWNENLYIGIDSSNKSCVNDDFSQPMTVALINQKYHLYAWGSDQHMYFKNDGYTYSSRSYGKYWRADDIIKMELNMNEKSLRFYLNDVDQGIASQDIQFKEGETYYLAVAIGDAGTSLKLISFDEIYQPN